MDVYFQTKRLADLCNDGRKLTRKYGKRVAETTEARLQQLEAVRSLEELRALPGRWHELSANLAGMWAADVAGKRDRLRLIVREESRTDTDNAGQDNDPAALVVALSDHYDDLGR
ncbi:MAG: hypothetical protein U0990_02755 [Candidatus Nanopelagicales bacterium]|nr:hypothetical protein [Candidatus Nanopelagicales bacterium]MDZ4248991.1 hypothetical protein [Candidatus Nanopelagicales bacterium]